MEAGVEAEAIDGVMEGTGAGRGMGEGISIRAPSERRASTGAAGERERSSPSGRPREVRSASMMVSSAASRSESVSCPERQRCRRPSAPRQGSSALFHERVPKEEGTASSGRG